MAYAKRRTTARRQPARRASSYRSAPKRSYARRAAPRRVRRTTAGRSTQTVRLVIQSAPAPSLTSPTDATMERASRVSRF